MNKQIGIINKKVIKLLDLNYKKEMPIYIGSNNINHMKKQHLQDFQQYRYKYRKYN